MNKTYTIYALVKNNKVCYVGQTIQRVTNRISQHRRTKTFDTYKVLEIVQSRSAADKREAYFVRRYIKTCYCKNGGLNKTLDGQGKKRIYKKPKRHKKYCNNIYKKKNEIKKKYNN